MFWLLVDTNNCQRQTKKQTQNTAADSKCFSRAFLGIMPSCIQNIFLVALLSITALSFSLSERMVAFFGDVSFVELFTGKVKRAPFVKPFAFRRSIVESGVKLDAWGGVRALSQFTTSLAVFVRLRTGAEIALSKLNTCGDSMILLLYNK